jgi:uncharacterized protein with PIN domain
MSVAYVDSSCIVAIALGERGAAALARRLGSFDELVTSNLLEAEVQGALARERVERHDAIFSSLAWILPDRPLSVEISRVLDAGYLRGTDCWHLATALFIADAPSSMSFLTLDAKQAKVASTLGFRK